MIFINKIVYMKNLFEIDSSEIKRILNLHEERTKTQYLDIVSEQDTTKNVIPTITTSKVNHLKSGTQYAEIPQNTIFKLVVDKKGNKIARATNVLVNKGVTTNISYYCSKKTFYVAAYSGEFSNDAPEMGSKNELANRLDKEICSKEIKRGNEFITSKLFTIGGGEYTIPPKTKFTKITGGASFYAQKGVQNSQWMITTYQTIEAIFKCSDLKFYVTGKPYDEDNTKLLTSTLKSKFCQSTKTPSATSSTETKTPLTPEQKVERAKNCGHKSWEDYKNSNWACNSTQQTQSTTQQGGGTGGQRRQVDITPSIRNVQKSIGVAETGSFDTETLNKIIQQL